MALKPSQLAFEKSLLEERLRYVKRLKEDLEQEGGATSQTVGAYTSIIDGEGGRKLCRKGLCCSSTWFGLGRHAWCNLETLRLTCC